MRDREHSRIDSRRGSPHSHCFTSRYQTQLKRRMLPPSRPILVIMLSRCRPPRLDPSFWQEADGKHLSPFPFPCTRCFADPYSLPSIFRLDLPPSKIKPLSYHRALPQQKSPPSPTWPPLSLISFSGMVLLGDKSMKRKSHPLL